MPVDLAALRQRRATAVVEYHGEAFNVAYRPEKYDANMQAKMMQVSRSSEFGPLLELLMEMLISWDLTDAGQPVPITPETLGSLPLNLLAEVARAVMREAISGDPTTQTPTATDGSRSSNGSPPAASSVTVNGPTVVPIGSM